MHVASVPASTSADWLARHDLDYTRATNPDAARGDLAAGRVDAVVYDASLLRHEIQQNHRNKPRVPPLIPERQDYAFALPAQSPLRAAIGTSLLKRINAPDWKQRVGKYFGEH
ncbi:MAG TPA: transporter substrate-binding domain-containing protein [Rudaea sp.]|nr:transporter substrate-binding domain-containing protein [Rudaea sp.]